MKNLRKQGISLIVLVITIIVIVILATAVILSIANNNSIENAKEAKQKHNEASLKEAANLAYLDWYSEDAMGEPTETAEKYVRDRLKRQGFSSTEIEKVEVTENGVTIKDTTVSEEATFTKTGELKIGEEVTALNGEEFYIIGGDTVGTEISDSTENIILLSKYNLKEEDGKITLKQDTSGGINGCEFSSTNYWSSVEGIAYPDSAGKYPDLNDEEKYPIGSATSVITKAKEYGASLGVKGRLMTSEEAHTLRTDYSQILYGEDTPNGYLYYWLRQQLHDGPRRQLQHQLRVVCVWRQQQH